MRRREFIAGLGSAVGLPAVAWAEQPERVRRIGMLLGASADDSEYQSWVGAFLQELGQRGWLIGRNMQIDTRWTGGKADDIRRHAAELAMLAPDVIVAHGATTVGPMLQASRTVPIVFPIVSDPIGAGFVDSLARPGGNATGFMSVEYGLTGKWLELLKQVAPNVTRVAVLRDATQGAGVSMFAAMQGMAPVLGLEIVPVNLKDPAEIVHDIAAFARLPNGGLIVTSGRGGTVYRAQIIALARQHKLPAVYYSRFFVTGGGLISYGTNFIDHYRQAAGYVDRILKGEKPADLPVQIPTKYETVLNLNTAKALGLTIPETLLATADEVIQ